MSSFRGKTEAVPLVYEPERRALFAWGETSSSTTSPLAALVRGGSRGTLDVIAPPGEPRAAEGTYVPLVDGVTELASIAANALGDVEASTAAWSLASKLALDLVARERMVPWADGGEARWAAALAAEDAQQVAALARAMPRAAHAVCTHSAVKNEVWEPETLLRAFLDATTDALVRRAAQTRATPPVLATTTSGWERRFARALTTPDGAAFAPEGFGERTVLRELQRWSRPARGARDEPRTCFRLELPTEGEESFVVRLLLQAPDDPSLLVDAAEVWGETKGKKLAKLGRAFRDPEEALLAGLGAAARVFPPLRATLDEPAPTALRLDAHEAWSFLAEAGPALGEAGFGVIVPAQLTAGGQRRLRLRMRVGEDEAEILPARKATQTAGKVEGAAGLAMEDLVAFKWQAAIGEEPLTPSELATLADRKAPLVRFRGEWVAVDPRELAEIKRRVAEGPKRVRLGDALQIVLAGETSVGGSVAPVVAEGTVAQLLDRLRTAAAAPERAPRALLATLRPYQERGLAWLRTMASLGLGGCLADDMGLGKTVQVLAFLLHRAEAEPGDVRPTLLVAPTSVVGNWEREIARFAPSLPIVRHYGSTRTKTAVALASAAREAGTHAIVLTTYGIVRRDVKTLAAESWSTVVLDEAQNAKNAASATAKAVRALPASHRFALTGTPVENRLAELWSILDFANPGMLGGLEAFRQTFAVPVERYGNAEAADKLRRIVAPFLLRRLKSDKNVIRDLPAKNEMDVFCTLTREQATLYKAAVDEEMRLIAKSEGIERRGRVLALITALKQICNHPAQYLGERGPLARRSGKLARITEMLEEALSTGDKALVFTQYREMGDRLVTHLAEQLGVEVVFLHGGTSKRSRDAMVQRFQDEPKNARVFVLSLKAGGTGLNLTAASHVFHYDRWWNPAVEDQATDRAYRIGQKRAVQVHKLVCAGTVEDRVAQLLGKKRELASKVVGAGERWITELGDSELRELVALSKDAVVSDGDGEVDR
jgi:superfamily II DNA or RNA helicase